MSLSVTRPAKKFQLFQPMGGVSATCVAADSGTLFFAVFGAACAATVTDPKAKTQIGTNENARTAGIS
jgi:hypothetical protein